MAESSNVESMSIGSTNAEHEPASMQPSSPTVQDMVLDRQPILEPVCFIMSSANKMCFWCDDHAEYELNFDDARQGWVHCAAHEQDAKRSWDHWFTRRQPLNLLKLLPAVCFGRLRTHDVTLIKDLKGYVWIPGMESSASATTGVRVIVTFTLDVYDPSTSTVGTKTIPVESIVRHTDNCIRDLSTELDKLESVTFDEARALLIDKCAGPISGQVAHNLTRDTLDLTIQLWRDMIGVWANLTEEGTWV